MLIVAYWWWSGLVGNVIGVVNEVEQRWAWFALGWVIVSRWVNNFGM